MGGKAKTTQDSLSPFGFRSRPNFCSMAKGTWGGRPMVLGFDLFLRRSLWSDFREDHCYVPIPFEGRLV